MHFFWFDYIICFDVSRNHVCRLMPRQQDHLNLGPRLLEAVSEANQWMYFLLPVPHLHNLSEITFEVCFILQVHIHRSTHICRVAVSCLCKPAHLLILNDTLGEVIHHCRGRWTTAKGDPLSPVKQS